MTYFLIYIICAIFIFLLMTLCCKGKYFVDTIEGGYECKPYLMDYRIILLYSLVPLIWPAALIEIYSCCRYGYCMLIHNSTSNDYINIKEKYGKRK